MLCPKCNKSISSVPKTSLDDGGLLLNITCNNCKSDFETFISPLDLDEIYIDENDYVSNVS